MSKLEFPLTDIILYAKFGWNLFSDSGEDQNVKSFDNDDGQRATAQMSFQLKWAKIHFVQFTINDCGYAWKPF